MTDVYAQARNLVQAVRQSPQWSRMRQLAGPVRSDPAGEQLLSQFRLQQFELQALTLQGQQPTPQQQAAFQQLSQRIQQAPALRQYMEAEQAYGAMLSELQQVLAEIFSPDVPGAVK